jgi:hypothetical protein
MPDLICFGAVLEDLLIDVSVGIGKKQNFH